VYAPLPFLPVYSENVGALISDEHLGGATTAVCDAWPVRCQTYILLSSQ